MVVDLIPGTSEKSLTCNGTEEPLGNLISATDAASSSRQLENFCADRAFPRGFSDETSLARSMHSRSCSVYVTQSGGAIVNIGVASPVSRSATAARVPQQNDRPADSRCIGRHDRRFPRSAKLVLLSALLSLGAASGSQAGSVPDFRGTWDVALSKIVENSCGTVPMAEIALQIDASGNTLVADQPDIVGVSGTYSGFATKDGAQLVRTESCPVVPDPVCSPDVSAFSFSPTSGNELPTRARVSYVEHRRGADGSYLCSIMMKGTATKRDGTEQLQRTTSRIE